MRAVAAADFATLRESLAGEVARWREGDPLRPLTVICPSDLSREETRRALARDTGGTFAVRVRGWSGWVSDLAAGRLAETGGRRLPEPGFERLVARCLEETPPPGPLARAVGGPGLARSVAATLAELLEGGFDAGRLSEDWEPRDALRRGLLATFHAVSLAQRREGLWDRRAEEEMARREIERFPADSREALLFFGFHDLTPRQRALAAAAAQRVPVSLLVPGPGGPGGAAAEPLLAWAREAGFSIHSPESDARAHVTMLEEGFAAGRMSDPGPDRLEIATYACESDEVRGIARAVRQEIGASARSFDDILVTISPAGPSPALFRRVFRAAGIPLADLAGVPAARTESGRMATVLARAGAARGDGPEARALDYLPAPSTDPEDESQDVFADPFSRFRGSRDWTEAATHFRDLYRHRLAADPSPEVEVVLESLERVGGSRPCRPRDFSRALGIALAAVRERTPLRGENDEARVLLVRADQARGVSRPLVFHAGLAEGAVHRLPREDPLLPDRIREELNDRFEHRGMRLRVREDARVERTLLWRFALESCTERTILSWSRRLRTGSEARNPSGLLEELAQGRGGLGGSRRPGSGPGSPVDVMDADLSLLSGEEPPGEAELGALLAEDRARRLPDSLRQTRARWRSSALTAHDGVLRDPRAVNAAASRLRNKPWSPTRLEAAANCPFSLLVSNVLGLSPPDDTDEDFDARARGTVFHEVLEILYGRLLRDRLLPLEPERLPGCLRMLDDVMDAYGREVRDGPRRRRAHRLATLSALRDDLAMVLALDAHTPPDERTEPLRFEYGFGLQDPSGAPRMDLGEGRALALRGKADRVDRRSDGTLEVVDVKTGQRTVRPGRISRTTRGRTTVHLQLPLYLVAVSEALGAPVSRASFFHATADQGFARIPFTEADLDAVRPRLVGLLRHVVDACHRGWFPSLPAEQCCRKQLSGCCGPMVRARFDRKAGDPDLELRLGILAEEDRTEPGR